MQYTNIIRGWESRFPHLDEDWTHWWLEGDGNYIALIDGCNLSEAVQIVRESCEQYISINAYRAKLSSEDVVIREKKRSYEIANSKNEDRSCFKDSLCS